MTAYLVNILLLLGEGGILLWYKPSQQNKKAFCILASSQWILLSGLRDYSVGADTYAYKMYFDSIGGSRWSSLWDSFINILFKGAAGKDPGYSLFEKLVSSFTANYQVYLIIIALIFTVPLGIWIYRNSAEPLMSFLIYSSLFYAFFAITGLRQTIATAFVVLIGYKFIKEKKFWAFLALVLVSATIHKSALCFLPFYFIANIKISKRYIFIVSAIVAAMFIFKNQAMSLLGSILGYEQYTDQFEGAGTWTFTALLVILFLVTIWKYKTIIENNEQASHYMNALFIALAFTPLTFVDPNAMRVVQYYSIFIMLLVPEIIKTFGKREKVFVYYLAATLLIVLFIKTDPQYLFFWQG
jgi:transmembrane protein EpsG